MAELDSEDSSDGTLVIDEPNHDCETIKINDDSDVEVIDLINDIEDTSPTLNHPSSSTNSRLTCKFCYRIFSTNNDLLNHIRKFKGRIGGCKVQTNINITSTIGGEKSRNRSPALKADQIYKKKKGNSPNIIYSKLPVPESIPICPQLKPTIFKPTSHTNNNYSGKNLTKNNLPSAHQMLVDDVVSDYSCSQCGQIFRHYIGLVCHLNSEHYDLSSKKVKKTRRSSTKSDEKKQNTRKSVIIENKPIENNEPISNSVEITMLPETKKDSLLSRMKSYVRSPNKDLVICVLCHMEFKNLKRALSHIENKHILNKIQCEYCNMKFVYELKLRSHMAKRHDMICVYKCEKCSKFINKEERDSHLEKCKGTQ